MYGENTKTIAIPIYRVLRTVPCDTHDIVHVCMNGTCILHVYMHMHMYMYIHHFMCVPIFNVVCVYVHLMLILMRTVLTYV